MDFSVRQASVGRHSATTFHVLAKTTAIQMLSAVFMLLYDKRTSCFVALEHLSADKQRELRKLVHSAIPTFESKLLIA